MRLCAIVPVKPFAAGKSRLAGMVDDATRRALNQALFAHVFETAVSALGANKVAVTTSDMDLLAAVHRAGSLAIADHFDNLNDALANACRVAAAQGVEGILVLPADLPFLQDNDVIALAEAIEPSPACAIAADISGEGTNALGLAPPDVTFFAFGPRSFAAHIAAAHARGIEPTILRRSGLGFDLDTPEDYRNYRAGRRVLRFN
jgi:2-phospho-L-lactate guanylyltransferase